MSIFFYLRRHKPGLFGTVGIPGHVWVAQGLCWKYEQNKGNESTKSN